MKITNEECTYVIPVNSGLHIINEGIHKYKLIDYMNTYFVQKRKTKCIVEDDDGELINPKEAQFIYISSKEDLSSIYDFKAKTTLNVELEKFIEENPIMFQSVEMIRKDLRELLTDQGMIRFVELLSTGIDENLEIETNNFTVSKVLQNLHIDVDLLTQQQKFIVLYNLLLYTNRNQFCIVYIDFEVDEYTVQWLKKIQSKNRIVLVSNDSIDENYAEEFDSIIVLSANDFVERIELEKDKANLISYALHPIVMRHPEYQNEKIVEIIKLFKDETSTFLIEFPSNNTKKAFI